MLLKSRERVHIIPNKLKDYEITIQADILMIEYFIPDVSSVNPSKSFKLNIYTCADKNLGVVGSN